jgi:hypothetical protein
MLVNPEALELDKAGTALGRASRRASRSLGREEHAPKRLKAAKKQIEATLARGMAFVAFLLSWLIISPRRHTLHCSDHYKFLSCGRTSEFFTLGATFGIIAEHINTHDQISKEER